jgi:hypothetical protein
LPIARQAVAIISSQINMSIITQPPESEHHQPTSIRAAIAPPLQPQQLVPTAHLTDATAVHPTTRLVATLHIDPKAYGHCGRGE